MSYTVLARKWRPKNFAELVGQTHVMQALANALDQQRLHHAYLFTGTRGVGKTTIARIFAKALNCQEGISSTPCGVCETCQSIDEGRFIDLIEVDAASKTKVDDTREILDNVQFAPTQGRYKVYLIDEVHMLSKSSFNALLKTLEEPPEHVKFLLATTDPHKLPITVLSRCLQFNLMRLTQPQMQAHLAYILNQEAVPFEETALALIAKSADGSARDSLSLLDQAIAYGAGEVMFEPVQTMLGLVDQQFGVAILQALAEDDAQQIKTVIQQLATMGVDYQALLAQLIESLHAISYVQVFGDNETTTLLPADIVQSFAALFQPERVQLLYQIALLTKQDMQLAPDIRIGFEMALMRMLAFVPSQAATTNGMEDNQTTQSVPAAVNHASTQSVNNQADQQSMSPADALSSLATARSLVGKKNASITENSPKVVVEKAEKTNFSESINSQNNIEPSAEQAGRQETSPVNTQASSSITQDEAIHFTHPDNHSDALQTSLMGASSDSQQTTQSHAQPETLALSPTEIMPQALAEPLSEHFATQTTLTNADAVQSDIYSLDSPHGSGAVQEVPENTFNNSNVQQNESRDKVPESVATDHLSQIRERLKTPFGSLATQTNQAVKSAPDTAEPIEAVTQSIAPETSAEQFSKPLNKPDLAGRLSDIQQSTGVDSTSNQTEHSNLTEIESTQFKQAEQVSKPFEADIQDLPPWDLAPEKSTIPEGNTVDFSQTAQAIENTAVTEQVYSEQVEPSKVEPSAEFLPTGNALNDWINLIECLNLKGMAEDLARNCVLVELSDTRLAISLDPEQQYAKPEMYLEQIELAVKQQLGSEVTLDLVSSDNHFTPVKFAQQQTQNKQTVAQQSIEQDSLVQTFVSTLGMEIIASSVKPV